MIKPDIAKYISLALNFYPPMIRHDVLHLTALGAESKLLTTLVYFGSEDISFIRESLYSSFRELFQNHETIIEISDKNGRKWKISKHGDDLSMQINLHSPNHDFTTSDFYALHPEVDFRIFMLNTSAKNAGMSNNRHLYWREIISQRSLKDDEISNLLDELSETPKNIALQILDQIKKGAADYSILIPDRENYYADLVGLPDGQKDIFSYSEDIIASKFNQLIDFEGVKGLTRLLTLSSHSAVVEKIDISSLDHKELTDAFIWISENADIVSKVGAVELGLRLCSDIPAISSAIIRIIEEIRHDDLSNSGRLSELSNLIMLVGGELARRYSFISMPPYWRRLATITHASVLQRSLFAAKTNVKHLMESSCDGRAQFFLIQTIVDLQEEPRWQSGYLTPAQLKVEFLGRILKTAAKHSDTISTDVHAYIFGDEKLQNDVPFPNAYFPGPLDGGAAPQMELPQELADAIESRLSTSAQPVELSSFITLINSALFFKLDASQADLASRALRTAKHQVRVADNERDLEPTLAGLAVVAAVTRSVPLADELIILVRSLRYRSYSPLRADQALLIGLVAAAAHSEKKLWIDFVGKWITEISFQELTEGEASRIRFTLQRLCGIVPGLWLTAGRAYAALESISS